MLGTLALALSAAPLFAQQSDTQSSPSPSTPSAQQPSQPSQPGQPGQAQPGQTPDTTSPAQPPAGQTAPDAQAQSAAGDGQSFSGTVAKSGDKFVLQDASGKTYDVDRQEDLKKYEGKQVRIKGTLDPDGKTIHVK
jgi:hypothetical protein